MKAKGVLGLGVIFDGGCIRVPVEGGEKALRVALRDPTIPVGIRNWIAENFSALAALVRAYSSAFGDAWIRIPVIDGEWAFV